MTIEWIDDQELEPPDDGPDDWEVDIDEQDIERRIDEARGK
jgi:hypothetical protein